MSAIKMVRSVTLDSILDANIIAETMAITNAKLLGALIKTMPPSVATNSLIK